MKPSDETPKYAAVVELDRMYAGLVERAEGLREAFFKTALALHVDKPGHIPIGIGLKKSSPNAYEFNWVKIELLKGEAKGSQKITTLTKGRGFKYPVTRFNFVKGPLNEIVRGYELQLQEIREAASMLMKIRRLLVAATKRVESASLRASIIIDGQADL